MSQQPDDSFDIASFLAGGQHEAGAAVRQAAAAVHEIYTAFHGAGFTEAQALDLTKHQMALFHGNPSPNA